MIEAAQLQLGRQEVSDYKEDLEKSGTMDQEIAAKPIPGRMMPLDEILQTAAVGEMIAAVVAGGIMAMVVNGGKIATARSVTSADAWNEGKAVPTLAVKGCHEPVPL